MIVAGSPTWADIDLQSCQKFLDDSGRAAFLSEYQHDFSEIEQGRVIPEYDEAMHVITWSQFERVFGARYIPEHWQRELGHDVGFTRDHQSAWVWAALYRIYVSLRHCGIGKKSDVPPRRRKNTVDWRADQ